MEHSIEKHMEQTGVTPEELAEALYCVRLALLQNNPVCDCPACQGNAQREEAQVELGKKAIELGIMNEEEEKHFWNMVDAKKVIKKKYGWLSNFYEKMSPLLPEDMLCDMEKSAHEMGDKIKQIKKNMEGH